MDPAPTPLADDESCLPQDAEMVRHGRLGKAEGVFELAAAGSPSRGSREHGHDPETDRVGQRGKESGRVGGPLLLEDSLEQGLTTFHFSY